MSRVVLVRHGQASFGKRNYDQLSTLGMTQAELAGSELARRQVQPATLICGSMERQRETARGVAQAAGWTLEPVIADAWNEYAHEEILAAYRPAYRHHTLLVADMIRTFRPRLAFEQTYAAAVERWVGGEFDDDYDEPFVRFGERVVGGLYAATTNLAPGQVAVVVSSGGVISWVAAWLLGGGGVVWTHLQQVLANGSLTTVSIADGTPTLQTFNDTFHLEGDPALLTTR